jgi:hypothetical protein
VGAGAAPRPVERVTDKSCFDRISGEIAACADEISVALELTRQRVGPKEVGAAPVTAVVMARVFRVQKLKGAGDAGVRGAEGEVVVVAHEDVREDAELEAVADAREPFEEVLPIVVVQEQVSEVACVRG